MCASRRPVHRWRSRCTRISGRGRFDRMYWTPGQMIAHHTSNGCNLRPGDLFGSGTVSGPSEKERGCLLELTSRLHGTLLDRHRPLWEAHLIEGLDDGRFAVYVKFQHALIDGVSAQRLLMRAMTPDPSGVRFARRERRSCP